MICTLDQRFPSLVTEVWGTNTFPVRKQLSNPHFQNTQTIVFLVFRTFSSNKRWWRLHAFSPLETNALAYLSWPFHAPTEGQVATVTKHNLLLNTCEMLLGYFSMQNEQCICKFASFHFASLLHPTLFEIFQNYPCQFLLPFFHYFLHTPFISFRFLLARGPRGWFGGGTLLQWFVGVTL